MSFIELFLIAVSLSMDAFAVAMCTGLSMPKCGFKQCLIIGLYFGVFQAIMPLIGYFLGATFAEYIVAFDHWVAFLLLALIGGKMVIGGIKSAKNGECKQASLRFREMIPLALATSIDALAIGISFAFLSVQIIPSVLLIGFTTLAISMGGMKAGTIFGFRFKSKAEIAGGVVLLLIGLKIVLEHLGVLGA